MLELEEGRLVQCAPGAPDRETLQKFVLSLAYQIQGRDLDPSMEKNALVVKSHSFIGMRRWLGGRALA